MDVYTKSNESRNKERGFKMTSWKDIIMRKKESPSVLAPGAVTSSSEHLNYSSKIVSLLSLQSIEFAKKSFKRSCRKSSIIDHQSNQTDEEIPRHDVSSKIHFAVDTFLR